MADNSDSAAVIAALNALAVRDYMEMAAMVVVLYEYLITFGVEVELFWGKDITGASIIFFLNRYLVLAYDLLQLPTWFPLPASTLCAPYFNTLRTFELLCYIPWGAFSALRVFALTDRNWALSVLVFLLSMGPVAVNFAAFHWLLATWSPEVGCGFVGSIPTGLNVVLEIVSRCLLIAADLIVAIITFVTTYKSAVIAHEILKGSRNRSFAFLLLRDGMVYFIILFVMNVVHLSFSLNSVLVANPSSGDDASNVSQFNESLTAILIWRLMLNLQRVRRRTEEVSSQSQNTSSLNFDRVIGSIGESLGARIAQGHLDVGGEVHGRSSALAANSDVTGPILSTTDADLDVDRM